jgi:selenide,water dikinase
MTTLNKKGAELIASKAYEVHALTDVTGFGLIGHAREMALASNVGLRLFSENLPLLPGALECAQAGHIPGGLKANREFAECMVSYEVEISEDRKALLFDPQTAGGLLISVSPDDREELVLDLKNLGLPAAYIGRVDPAAKPLIKVF